MTVYTNYDFYLGTYKGTAIALADFPRLAMRASAVIDQLTYNRTAAVITAGTDADMIEKIELATCAVAEELQTQDLAGGVVQSETIGRHSVTYARTTSTQNRLANAARIHLWSTDLMYRGLNEDE